MAKLICLRRGVSDDRIGLREPEMNDGKSWRLDGGFRSQGGGHLLLRRLPVPLMPGFSQLAQSMRTNHE